jgi:hypothetical protein
MYIKGFNSPLERLGSVFIVRDRKETDEGALIQGIREMERRDQRTMAKCRESQMEVNSAVV